ncbi:hypothetical protein R3P38DRAFT_2814339 [Favolaschia claudopus]|uniref:Uncharacterized protein n=1 Tax=Favolaschia claudopus TaxID=2862362 RepID=A0AAV9Z3U7_9AGAR
MSQMGYKPWPSKPQITGLWCPDKVSGYQLQRVETLAIFPGNSAQNSCQQGPKTVEFWAKQTAWEGILGGSFQTLPEWRQTVEFWAIDTSPWNLLCGKQNNITSYSSKSTLATVMENPSTDSVKESLYTVEFSPRLTPWEGIQPKIVIHPLKPPEFTPRTGIQPNRINTPQLSA